MVSSAQPAEDHGMTVRAATAPDIGTYPIYANFIWIDTSGPRVIKRTYNTSLFTWDAELPANLSITGAMIANQTITLGKIYPTPGLGGYVMRLNGASNAVIWDSPLNLFNDDEVPISWLELPGPGTFVLSTTGGTTSWATVAGLIPAGGVSLSQISTSGAVDPQVISFLGGTLGYDYVEDVMRAGETSIAKLEPGPANNLLGTNSAGTAAEWKTLSSLAELLNAYFQPSFQATGLIAMPAFGTPIAPVLHNLNAIPRFVRWVLVITTAQLGYAEDDEVDITSAMDNAADSNFMGFTTWADDTNLYLCRTNMGGTLQIPRANDGVYDTIVLADCDLKAYYSL
jgi:hypothetical protein